MVGQLLGQAEAVEDLASSLNEAVHHSLHRLESGDRLRTFMFGCAATYGYSALQDPQRASKTASAPPARFA
jgi:DNA-directed RNA polymerase specialized sigma24 family protein